MSMVKTPVEIAEEVPAAPVEAPGTGTKKRRVRAALREFGQRLARTRVLVKLGEMADRSFDEPVGTKARFCSVCRPHLQVTRIIRRVRLVSVCGVHNRSGRLACWQQNVVMAPPRAKHMPDSVRHLPKQGFSLSLDSPAN